MIRSVAMIAVMVTLAYLIWRTLETVDLGLWWISVPLLLLEVHAFVGLLLFTFSLWEVDALAPARPVERTNDRVAVLLPTYNEGLDVLLPTIAAAVALEPRHETWVLDDGRRPEVAELARSLGACYLTRPENDHAKAGNINHALTIIQADFIAVLDADHVATPNLLINTLGYFDDPKIALVQTPQDFYNLDSFEHGHVPNLTEGHRQLYHEQALFYRVIQPAKNRWGGAMMQVFRTENPLFVPGLSLGQRLTYAKTMLGWFDSWRTLGYLLIPPVVLFTGAMPITADATTFLVVFLATFIIQRIALSLLSRGYFRGQLQIVFDLVRMAPSLLATLTLFRSTPARFQVTPKGRVGNARRRVKVPNLLYALIVLSAGALVWFTLAITGRSAVTYSVPFAAYGAALWLVVNAWYTVAAIRRIRSDAFGTERRAGVRFGTELFGSLNGIPCSVQDLSLSGAKVIAPIGALLDEFAVLTIDPAGLAARFEVRLRSMHPFELGGNVYGLAFAPGQYLERGRLALALFKAQNVPHVRLIEPELAIAAD
ncbi:hypothetical protein BH24CHL1_BH24CHL1_07410 [soil metagenome]